MKFFAAVASLFALTQAAMGVGENAPTSMPGKYASHFNEEDLAAMRDFKFDHVMFKTKKDCALDNYPDVSTSESLTRVCQIL